VDPAYASSVKMVDGKLPVTPEEVISFLRSLLKTSTPAWQRLQAVRAIEAYRNLVLRTEAPSLEFIRQKLSRLADQERAAGRVRAVRFIQHCGSADLGSFGEGEIKTFLTDLAVEGNVTVGTQKQAKCALLFLYQTVLGRELGFLMWGGPRSRSVCLWS